VNVGGSLPQHGIKAIRSPDLVVGQFELLLLGAVYDRALFFKDGAISSSGLRQ
jgi:hypothetical protein